MKFLFVVCSIVFLACIDSSFAQTTLPSLSEKDTIQNINQNNKPLSDSLWQRTARWAIFGELSTLGIGVNLERYFTSGFGCRIGFQQNYFTLDKYNGVASFIPLSIVGLIGQDHAFELNGGMIIIVNGSLYVGEGVFPSASLGYRYQESKGGFLFRVAVGFPVIGSIGLGFSF